ncbi:MAG: hypothetical protein QME60_01355 [Verrucomicrobiota bacterium]|nr:hypothetical protein [Verrucomicrobiota bacterium]
MSGPKGSKNTPVGKEGLSYTSAEQVVGGPIDGDIKGSGLGADCEVKGGKSIQTPHKGKGGPKG